MNTKNTESYEEKVTKRYEEKVKKRKEAIKNIDKITINGATLVDGNNMFIEALDDINFFNNKIKELLNSYKISTNEEMKNLTEKSKNDFYLRSTFSMWWKNFHFKENDPLRKKWINVFEDYNPFYLAMYMDWLILHLSNILGGFHARKYTENNKILVDSIELDKMIENGEIPSKEKHIFYTNNHNIYLYDAKLPDRLNQIKQFEKIKNYQRDKRVIENIDEWIVRLKKGKYPQKVNGKTLEINWNVKNDALTYLNEVNFWQSNIKVKVLRTPKSGIFFREKGVDGELTLKMGDLAIDKTIDYICLVVNDSDYAPGIKRIIENNKDLYLFSMCERKYISKELRSLIKNENQIHQIDLLNYERQDNPHIKYFDSIFDELFNLSEIYGITHGTEFDMENIFKKKGKVSP